MHLSSYLTEPLAKKAGRPQLPPRDLISLYSFHTYPVRVLMWAGASNQDTRTAGNSTPPHYATG